MDTGEAYAIDQEIGQLGQLRAYLGLLGEAPQDRVWAEPVASCVKELITEHLQTAAVQPCRRRSRTRPPRSAVLMFSSTSSRATRSRSMWQPLGNVGNPRSTASRREPRDKPVSAESSLSKRNSLRCWPMKSST